MATKKKTTKQSINNLQSFRISRALVSLTYLGTMWRTALFFATLMAIVLVNALILLNRDAGMSVVTEGLAVTLGWMLSFTTVFALYDGLYVYVTQRYQLEPIIDKLFLFGMELILPALLLFSSALGAFVSIDTGMVMEGYSFIFWLLVFALLLLPVRIFLGVSYVVMTRKSIK